MFYAVISAKCTDRTGMIFQEVTPEAVMLFSESPELRQGFLDDLQTKTNRFKIESLVMFLETRRPLTIIDKLAACEVN